MVARTHKIIGDTKLWNEVGDSTVLPVLDAKSHSASYCYILYEIVDAITRGKQIYAVEILVWLGHMYEHELS